MSYAVIYGNNLCLKHHSKSEALASFFAIATRHANAQIFAICGSNFTNLTHNALYARENA
ncbi:hypothetical protein [Arthrobacter castelli]|uniref:hypothetical protein n=1 Tax=Arthrobacter castelli TaxID=271431 RepID=UPI000400B690|nr:hypothetical protein [Arthrobacter castelli]